MITTQFFKNAASRLAKSEGGKSQAKIGDVRQVLSLMMKQHYGAKKGDPSILLALAKKAGSKHMSKKKKGRK